MRGIIRDHVEQAGYSGSPPVLRRERGGHSNASTGQDTREDWQPVPKIAVPLACH